MPRNPEKPRASEVHWLSKKEKQAVLAQLPKGVSFSNYVREQLFSRPPLGHGGSRNEVTMKIKKQIAELKSQIATNLSYAEACEKTAAETGRMSAATQAAQHRAAAARKQTQVEKLEAQLKDQ